MFMTSLAFPFSKKDQKAKKKQDHRSKPKTDIDYIEGPQNFRKNVVELKNLQTVSEANLEEQKLRKIMQQERLALQASLKREHEQELELKGQRKKRSILEALKPVDPEKNYFMIRPLKYMQSVLLSFFSLNLMGLGYYEIADQYENIGWLIGLLTQPAASTSVALLLGCNMAFWLVRQSFCLNLNQSDITTSKINLISSSWSSVVELMLLSAQFGILAYSILFPLNFPLFKVFVALAATNCGFLALNIRAICKGTSISTGIYTKHYAGVVSAISLMVLLFGVYEVQLKAAESPEDTMESSSYRQRIKKIKQGNMEFQQNLKVKNWVMKESEKINFFDAQ